MYAAYIIKYKAGAAAPLPRYPPIMSGEAARSPFAFRTLKGVIDNKRPMVRARHIDSETGQSRWVSVQCREFCSIGGPSHGISAQPLAVVRGGWAGHIAATHKDSRNIVNHEFS